MPKQARKLNISKQAFTNADYKAAHAANNALDSGVIHPAHLIPSAYGTDSVPPVEQSDDTSEPVQTSTLDSVIQDITVTPITKAPRVHNNRTETREQRYPAVNVSGPDGAYLRFWASFADPSNPGHVVTFDNIRRRCVHIAGRNPHPDAGGKNPCADHARSNRLALFGFIVPHFDGAARTGFTFTDKARNTSNYVRGTRDEYCPESGRLLVLAS